MAHVRARYTEGPRSVARSVCWFVGSTGLAHRGTNHLVRGSQRAAWASLACLAAWASLAFLAACASASPPPLTPEQRRLEVLRIIAEVERNEVVLRRTAQRDCVAGDADACSQVGAQLFGSRDTTERRRGEVILRRRCRDGDARACVKLGFEPSRHYAQACETGDGHACGELASALMVEAATRYRDGLPAGEYQRAIDLHERACRVGALSHCGWAIAQLVSGPSPGIVAGDRAFLDRPRALSLARFACERFDGESCSWLLHMFLDGSSPRSPQEFDRVAAGACRVGHAHACEQVDARRPAAPKSP